MQQQKNYSRGNKNFGNRNKITATSNKFQLLQKNLARVLFFWCADEKLTVTENKKQQLK
jgi:hypothetical protein